MRMKILTLLAVVPLLARAEDSPPPKGMADSEKIDSIFVMQKQVVRTIKNDPLAGKRFGIEANLIRMLYSGEKTFSFSGGLSLFGVNRSSEISFPFLYSTSKSDVGGNDSLFGNIDFTEITQDVHYRYFLGNTQNGFYLSGFARYAHLSGIKGSIFDFLDTSKAAAKDARGTENKLGLGLGLGYRLFSYKGLYWGCSASFGRYLVGENDEFRGTLGPLNDDSKYIFDVELLKFGWAF